MMQGPWRRGPTNHPHPRHDAVKPVQVEFLLDTSYDFETGGDYVGTSLPFTVRCGQERLDVVVVELRMRLRSRLKGRRLRQRKRLTLILCLVIFVEEPDREWRLPSLA